MSTKTNRKTERGYHYGDLKDAILVRAAEIIGDAGIEALSLRGIARDLGVSHGAPNRHFESKSALLAALAAKAWYAVQSEMLDAAASTGSDHPCVRLNAMGRGFLRWAFTSPALYTALLHPDVWRYSNADLQKAQVEFQEMLHQVVAETQQQGRHPDVDPAILTLYTNSVPFGVAALMRHRSQSNLSELPLDEFIAELVELVVPIRHLNQ